MRDAFSTMDVPADPPPARPEELPPPRPEPATPAEAEVQPSPDDLDRE
jgi:hypothetical protein